MELALDFAIQCSPDHPWLKKHPEWFNWRPDGSVRYAENPPKKYEDIVNVDFYAEDAIPDLWIALRDIVAFWVGEGVRIFRVDNPHTKPLPFWEWLIAEVRSRNPDVIFLAEAFTRPKMMYRLAKVGFSQSYTYFTWRNTKQELTDYFTELTTSEREGVFSPASFRQHAGYQSLFPADLGTAGLSHPRGAGGDAFRPVGHVFGFRALRSSAVAGPRGISGFREISRFGCVDYDAPGNIVAEITKLNRIRKSQSGAAAAIWVCDSINAYNDQVILYGKPLPAQRDMILVAVSLDPFHAQEATIEVPLWEWRLPDNGAVRVHDLMHDTMFDWHGKLQRIRLDPAELPFAIWRIAPRREADRGRTTKDDKRKSHRPPRHPISRCRTDESARRRLWYKDACIYQLHVKSFCDSNSDGIGDFRGLDLEARLHRRSGRQCDLAAAVLSVAAAG